MPPVINNTPFKQPIVAGWGPIDLATYDGDSYSVATEETQPHELYFKPDGTKMYVIGATNFIYQYSLSVAWDISSTVTLDGSFDLQTGQPTFKISPAQGLTFKPDGTKMYACGSVSTQAQVIEYDLSTAWDITGGSASYVLSRREIVFDDNPSGIEFNPDGTVLYMVGYQLDSIRSYALSTAYDLSTLNTTSTGTGNITGGGVSAPFGFRFKPDGTKAYITGVTLDYVDEYNLSTAWDISTLAYSGNRLDINPPEAQASGIYMKPDGTKFWICGYDADSVHAFTFN